MNQQTPARPFIRKAFTLIELLAAMAISSALLIFLATLISQTTEGYAISQRSVNRLSQSRAFFHWFGSEMSLRLTGTPLVHLSSSDSKSDRIAFVRTIPDDEQNPETPGDLTTSCYYVAFVENTGQQPVPKLFRKILNPAETQAFIESGEDAEFPETDPDQDEPVIDMVLSFQATPFYFNPVTGRDEPWDASTGQTASYIGLSIRTIDESFARRIKDPSEWKRISDSPKESERQMIHTFSQQIDIPK